MVTTYSGIVPISGSLFEVTTTGVFPLVYFDSQFDTIDQVEQEANFRTEMYVLSADAFFPAGSGTAIFFDVRNSVDGVQPEANTLTEVTFINSRFDYSFAPLMTSTGISVVTFAFDGNFTYVVPSRINSRIFPTDVANATLWPGDRPRGSSLN